MRFMNGNQEIMRNSFHCPVLTPLYDSYVALISELIYEENPYWGDPVKYSYAHGGKDGVPFAVDTKGLDTFIQVIQQGVSEAAVGKKKNFWF